MTTLDALWEALAADIHANGYSVRDAIARHRPLIEAAVWDLAEEACAEVWFAPSEEAEHLTPVTSSTWLTWPTKRVSPSIDPDMDQI